MKNWGIRARVLFLALVPCALILVVLVGYFTYARIAEIDVALAQQGVAVARQLAPGAEFALFAGDRAALQRMTDAAAGEANVASVRITDASGNELARSAAKAAAASGDTVAFVHPVYETRLVGDVPEQLYVPGTPPIVGQITVTMSRQGARAAQQRVLAIGLALGLGCMIAAILLAAVIGDGVVRPVRALAAAMRELGRGRRAAPLDVSAGGELRTLQEGFNEMSARLRAGTEELQARIAAATRALSAERDTAQQATEAKSRFIAAASHDLRQPLHAIGMFTATLERRSRGSDVEGIVDDLARAVAVMDRLFDALLDVSKLDAGALHAEPRPLPLARVFAQLEAEHAEAATAKKLGLRFAPTSAVVIGDELLLHRLLGNLIGNAIRYTDAGSVMICARRAGDAVRIEVRDSGIGIAPDQQREIFREFYQIGNPARDRSLGLGLGLAIVSRIARLLGTEVLVRSQPGRGSVFHLRLPRADARAVAAAVPVTKDEAPAQKPPAVPVLVIDDDRLVLAGSRAMLEDLGCRVTAITDAASAESALAAIADPPVLVLCDLWLSDERSGIALLRKLSATAAVPIYGVLVSGDTRPETIQLAREAGFPLLHKPVSPAKLRALVTHFASKRRTSAMEGLR